MPASSVARYRMDVFRGRRSYLRLATNDPRRMADEYEAICRVAQRRWRVEMRDMLEGREGALIGYEELRRRQRARRYGNYVAAADRQAEAADRLLAKAVAQYALESGPAPILPRLARVPDWQRVRQHAYEYIRDAGAFGTQLDHALDRVEVAIRKLLLKAFNYA